VEDLLRTYVEHIAVQVAKAVEQHAHDLDAQPVMMITGGGAFNDFLVGRIRSLLEPMRVSVEVPDADIVNYKEAIIMALLGVLRWREEPTVMASVTGASRDSVGGAVWRSQV
jgi:anhydro-N-acetylmuramic acid kinase